MRENRKTLVDRIRHFTPSWFAVVMGTGVIGILVKNLPYGPERIRHDIAFGFLVLNTTLFVVFCAASIARYIMFPYIWSLMIREPVQSLFLATFPMALSTIISESSSLSQSGYNSTSLTMFLWILWWIDSFLAIASAVLIPYIMITRHSHSLEQQNAAWLLPVVPPIVSGSCGAVLVNAMIGQSNRNATVTVVASAAMVVIGLGLSTLLTATYMLRLIAHGFPKAGLVVSVYLPLGPCGQGGYAILLLSRQFATLVSAAGIADADIYGRIVTVMGTGVSLTLWAIGLWFGIISTIGLVEVCIRTLVPFRVNFWGMIFPNGVYSLLTLQLGKDLDSYFFRILGTTFSAITATLWAFIAVKSSWLAFEGEIFQAPCLDDASLNMPWHTPPIDNIDMSSIIDERRERTPS